MTLSNEPTLVCPKCAATLPRPFPTEPDTLNCAGCGTGYAFKGGVYRFVPTDGYAGSFGYQWKKRTPFYFGGEAEADLGRTEVSGDVEPARMLTARERDELMTGFTVIRDREPLDDVGDWRTRCSRCSRTRRAASRV